MRNYLSIIILIAQSFVATSQSKYTFEEQIGQSTIRIIVKQGTNYFSGTGFFFEFSNGTLKKTVLVTNTHVIQGMDSIILNFNKSIDSQPAYGDVVSYILSTSKFKWIQHPDTTIDLSILDLNPLIKDAERRKSPIYIRSIDETLIPNDSIWNTFTYLEDILMIGYPNGLIDNSNNLPIIRSGTTASQPKLNFDGKAEFITDIYNFGGSSGSPVFLRRVPFKAWSKEEGKVSIGPRPEHYFVGIHYKGEYFDLLEKTSKSSSREILSTELVSKYQVPLGIGHVIKSYKLLEFKNLIFGK